MIRTVFSVTLLIIGQLSGISATDRFTYGELIPSKPTWFDPRKTSIDLDRTLISIPEGFEYTAFHVAGQMQTDGQAVPKGHDGAGLFDGSIIYEPGSYIYIMNHELDPIRVYGSRSSSSGWGWHGPNDQTGITMAYDKFNASGEGGVGAGGTSTVVVDRHGHVITDYISLAGTIRNCAGGSTPWNTWITCEEWDRYTGKGLDNFYGRSEKRHGYCFEVQSWTFGRAVPEPLIQMGRFMHEAATTDPRTGIVYMTEDQKDGVFYRYIPHHAGQLARGGEMQVLAFKDRETLNQYCTPTGYSYEYCTTDTRTDFKRWLLHPLEVEWISLTNWGINVDPDSDNLRYEAHELGAAIFSRGEGMTWDKEGRIYWSCTEGGETKKGQIFSYDDRVGTIMLQLQATDGDAVDMPDTIVMNRYDGSMYLMEDGKDEQQFVVGAATYPHIQNIGDSLPETEAAAYKFVKNNIQTPEGIAEMVGGVFSVDSTKFFFSVQDPGITFMLYRTDGMPITSKPVSPSSVDASNRASKKVSPSGSAPPSNVAKKSVTQTSKQTTCGAVKQIYKENTCCGQPGKVISVEL